MTVAFKGYWMVSVSEQQELRQLVQRLELEAYAEEYGLIVHEGKAIKPEEYPCECELEDPQQCQVYKDTVAEYEVNDRSCNCECHRYFEPY